MQHEKAVILVIQQNKFCHLVCSALNTFRKHMSLYSANFSYLCYLLMEVVSLFYVQNV